MTRFYKLSGGGNDFVALAEPESEPSSRDIRTWCRRGVSIGADGLFVLTRGDGHVRMVHYNSDGGRASLCVNGTRCAARLAFELGWSEGTTRIETDAGPFDARDVESDQIELRIPAPAAPIRQQEQ